MQKGSIKQNGKWWVLKYRGDVMKGGVLIKNKDLYENLAPIDRTHQPKNDGTAPDSVLALRDEFMTKRNVAKTGPQSIDTFQAYLESYLAAGKGPKGMWNHTTKTSNEKHYRTIKPHIPATLKLKDVTTPAIQKILQSLYDADKEKRAQSTYNNIKTLLSSACRTAVVNGLMPVNPVPDAFALQGKDADTHAYSLKEVHALVEAIKVENNPTEVEQALTTSKVVHAMRTAEAAFLVAMFTGLRPEEIKGLRWEDYRDGLLHVERAVVDRKLGDVKSKASRAPVPVIGIVKAALDSHLKHNSGDGYIFHKEGDSQTPVILDNYIRNHVRPILYRKGVEWHGMYAFRRGLVTVLNGMDGIEDRLVSHVLRHEITKNDVAGKHYIKRDVEKVRRALEKVEAKYKAAGKRR